MTRSLFITRWGPDRADGGAALRNQQNIRALAALGPVDVLSIGGPETVHPVPGIENWTHFERQARPRGVPGVWLLDPRRHPLTDRQRHDAALAHVRGLAPGRYDVAVVEEIALSGYIAPLRAAGIPTVFDAHNLEAQLRADIGRAAGLRGVATRLRHWLQDRRLRRIEARALGDADLVWACSRIDADLIGRLYRPEAPVAVIPNAVNLDAYAPARAAQDAVATDAALVLLYIGTYSYPPNEAAALRLIGGILPGLAARGADMRLVLAGREPTPAMRQAAAGNRHVTITGAVDSILPYLSQPNIVVLPITTGSGTRLKILEAFAAGCPVVSTAKGAEGIAATPGEDIVIAELDADFIAAIERLAGDPDARRKLGAAGHRTAARLYSWQAAAEDIRLSLAQIVPDG